MSYRTVYGYARSENGWRMVNRDACVLVDGPEYPNTRQGNEYRRQYGNRVTSTAPLRAGVSALILGDFVRRYHAEVEPIVHPVWGWSATNDVITSNHLSGTAVDINAPAYPWGLLTMPHDRVTKVQRLLGTYGGAIFWGRRWQRADEMHFQNGWPEGDDRYDAVLRKLAGTAEKNDDEATWTAIDKWLTGAP